jgi:transcriptional regulator with XRE-family HTH domain
MAADGNPLAVALGRNLRRCRRRAQISQETLAYLTSLHRTQIGLLERGAREPQLGTILKLAGALSTPLSVLLDGIEWKSDGAGSGKFEFKDAGDAPTDQ